MHLEILAWHEFEVDRRRPVRFWLLFTLNVYMGAWMLAALRNATEWLESGTGVQLSIVDVTPPGVGSVEWIRCR
jgi:hypothetical protein